MSYAEEKSDPYFQSSDVDFRAKLNPFQCRRYRASVFVFLAEGKIIMEPIPIFWGTSYVQFGLQIHRFLLQVQ